MLAFILVREVPLAYREYQARLAEQNRLLGFVAENWLAPTVVLPVDPAGIDAVLQLFCPESCCRRRTSAHRVGTDLAVTILIR